MTDFNAHSEPNATPEDVATLYSWANLHGAKYRDFSAARAQTRETARLRAEQALAEARGHALDAAAGSSAGAGLNAHLDTHLDAHLDRHLDLEEHEGRIAVDFDQSAGRFGHVEAPQSQARQAQAEQEQAEQDQAEARAAEAAHEKELAEQTARQKRWAEEQEAKARETANEEAAAQQAAAQQAAAEQQARHEAETARQDQARQDQARQDAEQAQLAQAARDQEARELAAWQAAEEVQQEQLRQEQLRQEQARQEQARQQVAEQARQAAEMAHQQAADQAKQQAAEQAERELHNRPWPRPDRFPKAPFSTPAYSSYPPRESGNGFQEPAHELNPAASHASWTASEAQELAGGPAWLTADRAEARSDSHPDAASQLPVRLAGQVAASLSAPEDTLQGSRDRLTSRWFALRGIFEGAQPVEAVPAPTVSKAPAMAVFSLAGGVGKTSLVATLGRALSSRGERVLLVDTAAFGLLPFFFGATDQRPGVLRTFNPPGLSNDAPIQMVTIDPDGLGPESGQSAGQESLSGEINKFARGAGRVIVDLATASGSTTRRILRMSPLVLVPVIPDMNSVVSVSSIDAFFEHNSNPAGKPSLPFYVLNQFDASLPLHLDVREVLREQLGDRLLPFALRRMPAMSEALAEGMTVVDYAPNSPLADDFSTLAGWVKSLSAPATTTYRGVRWSER
jgi:cellulose synthase operon protein YhjQ